MCEISIIVPVYNVQDYLDSCIESILNQTFTSFELILVDDGSLDKSSNICDKYSIKDSRVRVFHISNSGVSYARNLGIKNAQGRYIMFCDSDDTVEKDWCEKLYKEVTNNEGSLVTTSFNIYNNRDGKLKIEKRYIDKNNKIIIDKKNYFCKYKIKLFSTIWNKIYEKKILLDNNIKFNNELSFGEDLIFNLDYLKKCNDKIIIKNETLYNHFLRDTESLDYKYHPNLNEIYKFINKRLYEDATLYNANNKEFDKWYWTKYYWDLKRVITTNTFHKQNDDNLLKKIIYNTKIVKSKDFKNCIFNLNEDDVDKELLKVLQSFNYIKIFMYFEGLSFRSILKKIIN